MNHVWLITEGGSFREFKNPAPGTGLYDVTLTAPSDEYRRLYYDAATPAWRLDYLDGRQDHFRAADGLWVKTTKAGDTFFKSATYSGSQLTDVDFPDGRKEKFTYFTSGPSTGKLQKLTEMGVGVTDCALQPESCREWTYTWSGDELTLVTRPDGTSWEMTYDPTKNGGRLGYLTQVRLVAGTTGRVEAAFEYTAFGKVFRAWRGDPSFTGPNAIDKEQRTYDAPTLPTQTVATEWINDTTTQNTTYALARDTRSIKPKITSLVGACPACGLAPTTSFTYGDSAHPLRETRRTNGRGFSTDSTYNGIGRLATKTEAFGTAQQRLTTYEYETSFAALLKAIQVPSTSTGFRRAEMAHNATTALLESRALKGTEVGGPAALSSPSGLLTVFTNNTSGQVETIDPPPAGGPDVTTFTYNVAGRNAHLPDQRIDPLIGATHFAYDALNRRTSVIDANGVETTTMYDTRGRVTEVRQKGAIAADDLVTTYLYDCPGGWSGVEPPADDPPACRTFGDLRCVQLPRGNAVEYRYDAMGRLTAISRKTDCSPATQPLERTLFTLDRAGNRTLERRQRWGGSAWITDSATELVYTSRCHADRMVQGKGSATESTTEYCYDKNNNLEKVWDALHTPSASFPIDNTLNRYDALDRLTEVREPRAPGVDCATEPPPPGCAVTKYEYDVQDHLSKVIDAENNQTTYTTGDRDLMTGESSPVSGTTTRVFDEHGQMTSQTDARGIVLSRAVDALDRVTALDYPGTSFDTTYTYDDVLVPFSKGRLTRLSRDGSSVDYTYDRFGRMLQDGGLTYAYDKNGYRTKVTYSGGPGGVSASYAPDFADRDSGIDLTIANLSFPVVVSAGYYSGGPLRSLLYGNGVGESHGFDQRYFPQSIQLDSGELNLTYTVDPVGNPTMISGTVRGTPTTATFGYADHSYYLSSANGPWGNRTWTYDKIGNRQTALIGGDSFDYIYAGGDHNPKLLGVTSSGRSWSRTYDDAGNQITLADSAGLDDLTYQIPADGRMSLLSSPNWSSTFSYDGRGFLRGAETTLPDKQPLSVTSLYGSDGVLRHETEVGETTSDYDIFYFAGRPVALLSARDGVEEIAYVTTDHLGAPILTRPSTGGSDGPGILEPFTGVIKSLLLRYPGQWSSSAFGPEAGVQGELYYNVHRWYEPQTGRYTSPDPVGRQGFGQLFGYAEGNPLRLMDPLGLFTVDQSCSKDCVFGRDVAAHGLIACGNINMITDVGLRDCVSEKCVTAKITCDDFQDTCGKPLTVETGESIYAGAYAPLGGDRINLCVGNWNHPPSVGWLSDTILHEFSHLCRWRHGMRHGVPQDPYPPITVPDPPPWQPPPPQPPRPWWRRIFG